MVGSARKSSVAEPAIDLFLAEKDLQNYRQLHADLWKRYRSYVGLIGAGATRDLKYPIWSKLLDELHETARASALRKGSQPLPEGIADLKDLPVRAAIYRKVIANDATLAKLLKRTFGPRKLSPHCLAAAIVRLPLSIFLTTNYDPSLERAHGAYCQGDKDPGKYKSMFARKSEVFNWNDENRVESLLGILKSGEDVAAAMRLFIHLHGVHSDPDSIVLTERDYVARYIRSQISARRLTAMLSFDRPLLCLGFSLDDIDLMEVFRQLHGLGGDVAIHYAIIPEPEEKPALVEAKRQLLQVKYGINAIFYRRRKSARSHGNLKRIVEHLSQEPAGSQGDSPRVSRTRRLATPVRHTVLSITQIESRLRGRSKDPDPCKGVFGGKARRNGFEVTSTVYRSSDPYWYQVFLRVRSTGRNASPLGKVRLYLHPTFPEPVLKLKPTGKTLSRKLWAWGAFTTGVYLESHKVALELDLAETDAPATFRAR